jgi:teichuronic acid biosynthesis glycosyltransferase TuaC
LKILSFSYCFPNHANPNWGIFVYHRLAAMASKNDLKVCAPVPWFPFLSTRNGNPGPEKDDWNSLSVYRPRFFYFPGILKNQDARFYTRGLRNWLHELCESWRPDILDAHFVWPDGVGVASIAKEIGIRYVITLRGKIYECLPIPSQRKQCEKALKNASAVISVSKAMADEAAKLGVQPDKIFVIPNGIDKTKLTPKDKARCRQELGLPEKRRILLTVSHLGHRKGHFEVIEALSGLPDDVLLAIVGGAAQGGTIDALKDAAMKFGVADQLILPGPQPYEKIPLYFGAADASVLASYREGCPNAVLESLACGTPVVATDVGAVRDILPAMDVGRIVPPQKVEPLREALADVLDKEWDPDEVVRKNGVKSWDEVANKVQQVFNKVLSAED